MSSLPNPLVRQATLSGTVSWSDGTLFDGLAIFTLNPPLSTGSTPTPWPYISMGATAPRVDLPVRFPVVITHGQFDPACTLPFNADVRPPNTRWFLYYLDEARQTLAGPGTAFTITATPFSPTIPTLTAPTAPTSPSVTLDT